MIRFYFIFFCGLLFISSCNDKVNIKIVTLPDYIELTSSSKNLDIDLLIPGKIFIKGDKLIIFEQLSNDMFKVFDLHSLKHLYSYGDRGRGPNEFISVGGDNIIENNTEFVEIHDVSKLKFVYFSDSSAHIFSEKPISLLHLKNPINRFRKLNDSIYYFDNIFEGDQKNEFTRLNIHTGERTYFSPYPNWAKDIKSSQQKYTTYLKSGNYNSFYEIIVLFYYRFPVMKFLDFDGNLIKEVHIDTHNSKFRDLNKDHTLYFVESSVLTDEYIYVLWIEKSKKDVETDPDNFKPEILVFDWDGNVVGRYKLDKPVISFTLSEKTGKIYCTSLPEEDVSNNIHIYDLPKIDNERTPLTRIQSSLYSADILEGYNFSRVSMEDGIDKIVEKNSLKSNINYFTQIRDQNGFAQHELESISISVYIPIDEAERNWSDEFLNIHDDWENFKRRHINIDGLNIIQSTYCYEFLNPRGKIEKGFICSYFFEKDNSFVIISIYSKKDNFAQFHSAFKKMIHSFEFK